MKKIALFLIQLFRAIHPFIHQILITVFGISFTCRQRPSCSEYTISQIENHGTITGLKAGLIRIINCHTTAF